MSKRSLIACSFTPACFHQERSKSSMSVSTGVNSLMSNQIRRGRLRSGGFRGGSGEEAAGEMRLGHPAHADPVGRLAESEAAVDRQRVDLVEGALHDQAQAIVDLILAPEVRLDVL